MYFLPGTSDRAGYRGCVGEMYRLTSDNPFVISSNAAGVGHMMAFHVGARLVDMEQIQFVPIPCDPEAARNLRFFPDFFASPYYDRHGNILESNPQHFVGNTYRQEEAHARADYRDSTSGRSGH